MEKVKVRINNSHKHIWAVVWNGQPEDFSDAKDITLIASVRDKRINLTQGIDYVIEGNLVKIDFTPRFCKNTGVYNIELNYTKPSESFLSGERRTAVDLNVIEIVGTSACADATDETSSVSEAAFGFQGLSAYEVWLKDNPDKTKEEYYNWLQKPATDIAETVGLQEQERVEAENTRRNNEEQRVTAETNRQNNFNSFIEVSESAVNTFIGTAQGDINEAISNAETATENANTAAQNADDARLAIQDDLALKADHGYESNPKTLKEVDDDLAQLADEVSQIEVKDAIQDSKIKDIENVLSTANLNQSAQLSVSGASPLSLPKNAANGGMSVKLEGLTAENLVVNGDFRNGTTGWGFDGAATIDVSTGRFVSTAVYAPHVLTKPLEFVADNKYYFYIETEQSAVGSSAPRIMVGYTPGVNSSTALVMPNVIGLRKTSGIYTPPNAYTHFRVYTYVPPGQTVAIDNIRIIDLTQTFGAGNEPTKEECDLMFSDYFEGVKSFEPTGRVRSVDKNGLNPTALYLIAPELRSNGTVKDEIRKGANGYELVKRVGVGTLGNNLVTNGTFDTATGWTVFGESTISNGSARIYTPDGSNTYIGDPSIILSSTKAYKAIFDVLDSNGQRLHLSSTGAIVTPTPIGTGISKLFVGNGGYFSFRRSAETLTDVTIDNVKLHEVLLQDGAISDTSTFTELSDGTILYTLATPEIIPISYGGVLNSAENGTVYHEPIIADAGVYETKMDILLTDYPIASIEEIIKHENGVDTYLNVASAVVASDGLNFTHPDLADGDLVLFTYAFDKESTNGNITATFYDSNVVKIDTVTGKAYKIEDVVTDGVLTRILTEV